MAREIQPTKKELIEAIVRDILETREDLIAVDAQNNTDGSRSYHFHIAPHEDERAFLNNGLQATQVT